VLPSGSVTVTVPLYWPVCGQLISETAPDIVPLQLDTEPENVSSFTALSGSLTVTEIVTVLRANCAQPSACVHDTRLIEGRFPVGGSPDMGLSLSFEHAASIVKTPIAATNTALMRNCIFPRSWNLGLAILCIAEIHATDVWVSWVILEFNFILRLHFEIFNILFNLSIHQLIPGDSASFLTKQNDAFQKH